MAMTFVVLAGYGVFAAAVRGDLVDRPRLVRGLRRMFAASFVAVGAKLALRTR
jgi:threonine/homoserine/homoserine lactone efflux protein